MSPQCHCAQGAPAGGEEHQAEQGRESLSSCSMASLQLHSAHTQPLWAGGFQILRLGRRTLLSGQGRSWRGLSLSLPPLHGHWGWAELGSCHCLSITLYSMSPVSCCGTTRARDTLAPRGRRLSRTKGQERGTALGDREHHWEAQGSQDMCPV